MLNRNKELKKKSVEGWKVCFIGCKLFCRSKFNSPVDRRLVWCSLPGSSGSDAVPPVCPDWGEVWDDDSLPPPAPPACSSSHWLSFSWHLCLLTPTARSSVSWRRYLPERRSDFSLRRRERLSRPLSRRREEVAARVREPSVTCLQCTWERRKNWGLVPTWMEYWAGRMLSTTSALSWQYWPS